MTIEATRETKDPGAEKRWQTRSYIGEDEWPSEFTEADQVTVMGLIDEARELGLSDMKLSVELDFQYPEATFEDYVRYRAEWIGQAVCGSYLAGLRAAQSRINAAIIQLARDQEPQNP